MLRKKISALQQELVQVPKDLWKLNLPKLQEQIMPGKDHFLEQPFYSHNFTLWPKPRVVLRPFNFVMNNSRMAGLPDDKQHPPWAQDVEWHRPLCGLDYLQPIVSYGPPIDFSSSAGEESHVHFHYHYWRPPPGKYQIISRGLQLFFTKPQGVPPIDMMKTLISRGWGNGFTYKYKEMHCLLSTEQRLGNLGTHVMAGLIAHQGDWTGCSEKVQSVFNNYWSEAIIIGPLKDDHSFVRVYTTICRNRVFFSDNDDKHPSEVGVVGHPSKETFAVPGLELVHLDDFDFGNAQDMNESGISSDVHVENDDNDRVVIDSEGDNDSDDNKRVRRKNHIRILFGDTPSEQLGMSFGSETTHTF